MTEIHFNFFQIRNYELIDSGGGEQKQATTENYFSVQFCTFDFSKPIESPKQEKGNIDFQIGIDFVEKGGYILNIS
jgi:hypothetical protein